MRFYNALLIVLLILFSFHSRGKTFIVSGNGDNLQKIISLANNYDTVLINKGYYKVYDIKIAKSISIIGKNLPVLDGDNKGNIFIIKGTNITVTGLHIINSRQSGYDDPAGIKIENSKNIIINNCQFTDCLFAIYFSRSKKCNILNNKLSSNNTKESNSGNGIHLWNCSDFVIDKNTINGHRDGIYLEFTTNSRVISNISENNIRYGLHFMFSHNNTYLKNVFRNNGAGVAVMYTKNVNMTENTFIDNNGTSSYGLLLKDITDSEILNNRFIKNTCAITMEECNRINILSNNFIENGWAVRIQASCSDNIISNNNFIANTFDITTNGTLVLNRFDNNYWDKYTGYDLDKDRYGDIPYMPVSMYSVITDQIPVAMILYRSFIVSVLEQIEKIIPSITPVDLKDNNPRMKPYKG